MDEVLWRFKIFGEKYGKAGKALWPVFRCFSGGDVVYFNKNNGGTERLKRHF